MISDISFRILVYSVAAGSKRLPAFKFGVVENRYTGLTRVSILLMAWQLFYRRWQVLSDKLGREN